MKEMYDIPKILEYIEKEYGRMRRDDVEEILESSLKTLFKDIFEYCDSHKQFELNSERYDKHYS